MHVLQESLIDESAAERRLNDMRFQRGIIQNEVEPDNVTMPLLFRGRIL